MELSEVLISAEHSAAMNTPASTGERWSVAAVTSRNSEASGAILGFNANMAMPISGESTPNPRYRIEAR